MTAATPVALVDRKFVVAASLIGGLYALAVAVLGALLGKEAAGVAGVALTALATGIFKQFETLRFRQLADEDHLDIQVPRISFIRIAFFTSAFFGIQFLFGLVFGIAVANLEATPSVAGTETFFELVSDWRVLVSLGLSNALGFFIGGYMAAKVVRFSAYSNLLIAALATCIVGAAIPFVVAAVRDPSKLTEMLTLETLWPSVFWLVYVSFAFLGASYAQRQPIPITAAGA